MAILSGLSSKVARKSNDKISLSLRLPIDHVVVQTFYVYSYCLSQSKLHGRSFILRIPASKIYGAGENYRSIDLSIILCRDDRQRIVECS